MNTHGHIRELMARSAVHNLEHDLGRDLLALVIDQADWSQTTFGSDAARGPVGAIRHLTKESKEAEELALDDAAYRDGPERQALLTELADCFILVLDATRRAQFTVLELIQTAQAKMKVNRERTWPKPTTDQPVEHVR